MDIQKNGKNSFFVSNDEIFSAVTGRIAKNIIYLDGGGAIVSDATTGREEFFIPDFKQSGGEDTTDATAIPSDVSAGVTFYGADGKKTGTMPDVMATKSSNVVTVPAGRVRSEQKVIVGTAKGAATYTPGTSDQTINDGTYLTGKQTIKGDSDLTAANIKAGVNVFGVAGSFTSDADATAADIAEGKTAYIKGEKVTGTAAGGVDFYKCASVDKDAKTWTGYKAVLKDGIYSFEETVTAGLKYGDGFTPSVGNIYTSKADVHVKNVYAGVDESLVFHASLASDSATAETGQTLTKSGDIRHETVDGIPCAYFNGSSHIACSSKNFPLGDTSRTMALWFKPTGIGGDWKCMFGYGVSAHSQRLYLSHKYSCIALNLYGSDVETGIEVSEVWQHFLVTTEGNKYRIYINGTFIEEGETTLITSQGTCTIGELNDGSSRYTGYIADCRIYNRALTQEEITQLASELTPAA